MPAQGEHARRLHAADAAAHDGDLLLLLGGDDLIFFGLHRLGVEGAARHARVVVQGLVVAHALVVRHVEAPVVAVDAGADVLLSPFERLGDPLRIGKILPRNAHRVDLAPSDGFGCRQRIHLARADDGDIDELLDVLDLFEVAVFGHVCRRMRPIPGVVGAVVAVEHIVSRILQILCGAFALFHVAAHFGVFLARERALAEALRLGDDGIAQRDGEVVAARLLDGLDDLDGEAVAVFKAAAVFVRAEVGVLHRELIEKIPLMHGMDLHAVHVRVFYKFCRLCKGFDHLLDLFLGERAGDARLLPAVGGGARARGEVRNIENGLQDSCQSLVVQGLHHDVVDGERSSEACRQLDKELGARLVEFLHEFLELFKFPRPLIQPFAEQNIADGGDAGQDEPDVLLGAVQEEFGGFLVEVVGLHPPEDGSAAHRRQDEAVLDLAFADLPARQKGCILFVHAHKLLLMVLSSYLLFGNLFKGY